MSEQEQVPVYEGWAIVEVMGHRRLAGWCCETRVAGAAFLQVNAYKPGEQEPTLTQLYNPSSIFALTPATEDVCRRLTIYDKPAPVSRYELPAPEPTPTKPRYLHDDDEQHLYDDD